MAPLVSVITPTWQRHDSLFDRCIASVESQPYKPVEHIIVSDGPDEFLRTYKFPKHVRYYELPEHTPANGRWGTAARLLGIDKSKGELIAYLDDDDKYRPEHISQLAALLTENPVAGFAYGVGLWIEADNPEVVTGLFGNGIPSHGQIGTGSIMHHREILKTATWGDNGVQVTIDWDLVEHWLAAGIKYDFTHDHEAGTEHIWRPEGHGITAFR